MVRVVRFAVLVSVVVPLALKAGTVTLVDSFSSPSPYPRMGLDFDPVTRTLWSIDNASASPDIMNFDLSGNLRSRFTAGGGYNHLSVTVDPAGGRIFHWENLPRYIREASYPHGFDRGISAVLPWGYQSSVRSIDYDPEIDRIIGVRTQFAPSIPGGFVHIEPGRGIEYALDIPLNTIANIHSISGFAITPDSYWVIGPTLGGGVDRLVRLERTLGHLRDVFILPDSDGWDYRGLAIDPTTDRVYMNYTQEGIRVFELEHDPIPEPTTIALLGLGSLMFMVRRGQRHVPVGRQGGKE